jgi:hypothetical protein
MADEEKRDDAENEAQDEEAKLFKRFPDVPPLPSVPNAPKLAPKLPPYPDKHPRPGQVAPGSYNKMAIATTAASAFIMPIIVLSVGGWYLDNKLHHKTDWLAFLGVLIGMIVGVSSLLKVVSRLSD